MVRAAFLMGALTLAGCDGGRPKPEPTQTRLNEFYEDVAEQAQARQKPIIADQATWSSDDVRSAVAAERARQTATALPDNSDILREFNRRAKEADQERRIETLELQAQDQR